MTDIEKLAAAFKWRHPDTTFVAGVFWDVLRHAEYLGLMPEEIIGLAGGTHVVVPVEPTTAMTTAGNIVKFDNAGAFHIYKAMLKAAQE